MPWWYDNEDPNGWDVPPDVEDPATDRIFRRQLKRNRPPADEQYSQVHHPRKDTTMDAPSPATPGTTKTVGELIHGEVVTVVAGSTGIKVLDHVPCKIVEQPSTNRDGSLDTRWVKISGSAEHGVQSLFGGVWPATYPMFRTHPMVAQEDGSWLVQL